MTHVASSPLPDSKASPPGKAPGGNGKELGGFIGGLPTAIYTCDIEGRVTFFNRAAAVLWGREPEIGQDLWCGPWRVFHPDGTPMPLDECPMAITLRERRPVRDRAIIIERPDGSRRHIMPYPSPIFDGSGAVIGAVNMLLDITDRKEAESLREIEGRKDAILRAAIDAIISIDHVGNILEFNPAAERVFGYTRELAMGRPLADLIIPPRLRDAHHKGLARYLATGEGPVLGKRIELPAMRAGGGEFIIELAITRIPDHEPPVFTAHARDITERKQAERVIAEQARFAALRVDIAGELNRSGPLPALLQRCAQTLVTYLDAAFVRIWTLDPGADELLLRASAGLYTHLDGPHGRVKVGEFKIGRIAQSGRPHLTNDVPHDANISDPEWAKSEGMVAFAGYPLRIEGRVAGVLALFARQPLSQTVIDELAPLADAIAQCVERKQSEERLRHLNETLEGRVAQRTTEINRRAAQLRALITELTLTEQRERKRLAHVLHDHLQQLLVASQIELSVVRTSPDPAGRAQSFDRIEGLLKQSIDASRSLTVELSPPILSDAGLPPALLWLAKWMEQTHKLAVEVRVEGDEAIPSEEARVFLFTAVRELLFNTVKHAGVQSARVTVDPAADGEVRVTVEDEGAGFDPAVVTLERVEGGFGLFNIRERLELMGGSIQIDSRPGRGTCTTLSLPLTPQTEKDAAPEIVAFPHPTRDERASMIRGGLPGR